MLALAAGCELRIVAQPSQPELVERASAYVTRFLTAFSNVVADERYERETVSPRRRRTLRSDVLLVRYPGASAWHVFRDVLEVDGRAVGGPREGPLAALFLAPAEQALPRAQASPRQASVTASRTSATSTIPCSRWRSCRATTAGGSASPWPSPKPGVGPAIRIVHFEEVRKPTMLRLGGNLDMPAKGRLWIDETDGRVVKTELRVAPRESVHSSTPASAASR